MTYQDSISVAMENLGKLDKTVFLGQGLVNAGRIYGTLNSVSLDKCIEMPIAENLIAGTAIGLSLRGYLPIVVFQRMDFMLIASDAIINHMAQIPKMSGGKVQLPIIIRAIIGSQDPHFQMGEQHSKDLTYIFKPWISTFVLDEKMNACSYYQIASEVKEPTLIVEKRDLYSKEIQCSVN